MAKKTYRKFSKKGLSKKNKLRKGKRKSLRSKVKNRKHKGGSMLHLYPGHTLFLVNAIDAYRLLNEKDRGSLYTVWHNWSQYLYYINFSKEYKDKHMERRWDKLKKYYKKKLIAEGKITENEIDDGELIKKVFIEYKVDLAEECKKSVLTSNRRTWFPVNDIVLNKNYGSYQDMLDQDAAEDILKQIHDNWDLQKEDSESENPTNAYFEKGKRYKEGWKENTYVHGYPVVIEEAKYGGFSLGYTVTNEELIRKLINLYGIQRS